MTRRLIELLLHMLTPDRLTASHPPFFTEDGNPIKLYEKIIACKVRYPPYFETGVKCVF